MFIKHFQIAYKTQSIEGSATTPLVSTKVLFFYYLPTNEMHKFKQFNRYVNNWK